MKQVLAAEQELALVDNEYNKRYDSFNPKYLFGQRNWYENAGDKVTQLVVNVQELEDELQQIRQWQVKDGCEWHSSLNLRVSEELRNAINLVKTRSTQGRH